MKSNHLAIVLGCALLAGCNTMHGVGQDVSSAGHALTNATSGSSSSSTNAGVSAERVKQAQAALHSQGLYDGPIDGVDGPATRSAVTSYQQRKGLPATGELDSATLRDLTGSTSP